MYLERKQKIASIKKQDGETLYDAWEMLKLLLKRCLGHKFNEIGDNAYIHHRLESSDSHGSKSIHMLLDR